ncbi:MAG: hypothetical protein A2Z21_10365 [Candidatus Fraserbacteria bacterium RBG_16_55_9]|uniref:Uncharacterized protein n=1 Tax=Fraserbacteria sp. (strain RBG_16_55_9) TaxID=1817864 RepID=A0A1F5URQ6_FRAXR|nr:MAG: hypothetical protein A2Z21_10365 [Candidatus Fraserbacteria bacterium RBG_16_55_9]
MNGAKGVGLGGSYALTGIGVGLAAAAWGASIGWAILYGLFWPVSIAYWVTLVLHRAAGG